MTIDNIKKIAVFGAGLMGKQIALNNAIYGYDTWLTDVYTEALPKVQMWAEGYLSKRMEKGKLSLEEVQNTLNHFHIVPDFETAAQDADLVIEAIIEQEDAKKGLFEKLNEAVSPETIICTNSSFMVSSKFAGIIKNPSRLANFHYFNPALSMKLVEVVKGEHTSEETAQTLLEFARKTGKKPVLLRGEIEGFIVNRVVSAIDEAAFELVDKGITTPEEIDIALENGLNHPMGPFRLMDLTGVDLTFYVMEDRRKRGIKQYGYDLIKEKYEAGELGMKTGRGWYDYREGKK